MISEYQEFFKIKGIWHMNCKVCQQSHSINSTNESESRKQLKQCVRYEE